MEFVARFVSEHSGVEVHLPLGRLIVQNIVLLFVPLFIGIMFRHYLPGPAAKVNKVLSKLAFPALMTLALVFFLQNTQAIKENIAVLGVTVTVLILLAMLCSSTLSWMTKSSVAVRRTIVIEVGMQNAAQAIAIASSPFIFNSNEMAIPAIIYALLMNVILLVYVGVIKVKG
jgi:BASS family bile acid:Na+ symporter